MPKHAHIQIEYHNKEDETVETLSGFDPRVVVDRQFAHALLDEYLDRYLIPRLNGEERVVGEDDRFIVFNSINSH